MGKAGKAAIAALLAALALIAAAQLGLIGTKQPLGELGTEATTTTSTGYSTPATTSSVATTIAPKEDETAAQNQPAEQKATSYEAQNSGEGGQKLPRLLENTTLKKLEEIIKSSREVGKNAASAQCSLEACRKILNYYRIVKEKNMSITHLFADDIVDINVLREMHKTIYSSFTLESYNITWLGRPQVIRDNGLVPPGYTAIYVVKYLYSAIYVDENGASIRVNETLVTILGERPDGTVLIINTLRA